MELSLASRRAITRSQPVRYRRASKADKSAILDSVCAVTGFNRDYARRALRVALTPKIVVARPPREPKYDANVVAALQKCWAVLNAPAGKRLAPMLGELVRLMREHGELDIDDDTAGSLTAMSAATIDRRLAAAKSRLRVKGRSHTKPGSLQKSRIPMRTWTEHDENAPAKTDTFLGERYRRIVKRRGKLKALVAVARSILVIVWQLLSDPFARFCDLGSDYHASRINIERRMRSHIAQLAAMGYRVTVEPAA